MSDTIFPTVDCETIIITAADLLSMDGENPEYDRAIVELFSNLCGFTEVDKSDVESALRKVKQF